MMTLLSLSTYSQIDTNQIIKDTSTFRIIKFDGAEFIGKIISIDPREILVKTNNRGLIYIPQHEIKEIILVKTSDYSPSGEYVGEDIFATRYFITTNGLPMKKGQHYVQWNLYGPDFQFGIADNFGIGIMTTWGGMPIVGNAKYSIPLSKKVNLAFGGLVGTGSWALPDWGLGLPFAAVSFGDRKSNLSIAGGYGFIASEGDVEGRGLTSIAGMTKVGKKISLVFDSFIVLPGKSETVSHTESQYNPTTMLYENVTITETNKKPGVALIIPGIRWHIDNNKAFQFGFAGVYVDGEFLPIPIPMVQWYRKL